MRRFLALFLLLPIVPDAHADTVPLPRPRPATAPSRGVTVPAPRPPAAGPALASVPPAGATSPTADPRPNAATPPAAQEPSACALRIAELADFTVEPDIASPGGCEATDVVRLEAVRLPSKLRVAITPPAILRCAMAEQIVAWLREEAAPALASLGAPLARLENYDSFDCRGRNRVFGAKLSEHGKANAIDIRFFKLTDGRAIFPTDMKADRTLREKLRGSICGRFTTVLGPGSDGYHEDHIHLDLAARRGGYRICNWQVKDPPPPVAAAPAASDDKSVETPGDAAEPAAPPVRTAQAAAVPLPKPRPPQAPGGVRGQRKQKP